MLKNLTSIFVVAGDWYFYGRTYNLAVWGCVGLMLLSAICGGITDLSFDANGYLWQIVNCGFTAAYSLYLRGAMDRVAEYTSTGKKLDEFSMVCMAPKGLWCMLALELHLGMQGTGLLLHLHQHPAAEPTPQVFYNNLFSLPFIFVMSAGSGEVQTVWYEADIWNPRFQVVAVLSGLMGFGIRWARAPGGAVGYPGAG